MKVTVCQLDDNPARLSSEWSELVSHVKANGSRLLVLPEMIFSPWLAARRDANVTDWDAAVKQHDHWLSQLDELGECAVIGSRPIWHEGVPYNEGFYWSSSTGYRNIHWKYYLPDEDEYWEATWYRRGPKSFETFKVDPLAYGVMLCTDMWFTEHARAYGQDGIHILAVPRCTAKLSTEKWLAGGTAAAIMGGAYCISSNRAGTSAQGTTFGGAGWIIDPEAGSVLALTSATTPFITTDISIALAEKAKQTYPRYVLE